LLHIILCLRGANTCAAAFLLDINPITLKVESDLYILKMYYNAENEVARLRHSKLVAVDEICMVNEKKYLNSSPGQKPRSSVTNFQPLLAFTDRRTYMYSWQDAFLISSFRDFVRTDRHRDRRQQNQYLLASSVDY